MEKKLNTFSRFANRALKKTGKMTGKHINIKMTEKFVRKKMRTLVYVRLLRNNQIGIS